MSNVYKNTAFWSWNADIEKEEALWQLEREAGEEYYKGIQAELLGDNK